MDVMQRYIMMIVLLLMVMVTKAQKGDNSNKDTLQADTLKEVVVMANQTTGSVTSSVIGRDAMQQLQPTSIADLMELLPGGYAKDPNMSQMNSIQLRETGAMSAYGESSHNQNYDISSLGTQFVVDGVPLITDANMQYSPLSSTQSSTTGSTTEDVRNNTNRGVDMRSISTDDIEQVEVVRGIPSVEYGNLSSGLVNIKKIRRSTPLTARFKADGYSKLFSVGKGFTLSDKTTEDDKRRNSILNIDLGYLDSKQDPTDNLSNYQRINASARLTMRGEEPQKVWRWESALDYTGSFDDSKQDPDLNYGRIDEYKSSYSRVGLTNNLMLRFMQSWFRQIDINTSISQQFDRLRETKLVAPQRYGIIPTSYSEGEQEVKAVYNEYVASYLCDGKPFTAYIKAKALIKADLQQWKNDIKIGFNWDISKNFGDGQVYDLNYPMSLTSWSSRPRKYSDIPSLQNLSFFAEDGFKVAVGSNDATHLNIEGLIGVRLNTLLGLSSKYTMSGKYYADPRMSVSFHLLKANQKSGGLTFTAGYGVTSKMPTLNYLYPDPYYTNFLSLTYYDANNPTQDSRFVVTTYIQDPTNYDIKPARNHKLDLRLDYAWGGNTLSVGYFHENMTDGFRYSNIYKVYTYNYYDATQMQAGMDYHSITPTVKRVLDGYTQSSNGTRIVKQGIEWQYNSARIKALKTRINVSGAWFRTQYTNSQPMLETVSTVINNQSVSQKYVGLYDWVDGRTNDRLNTNITFDTQIPRWGLIFTTSAQCMWLVRTKLEKKNGMPVMYLSADDGEMHEYTEEAANDIYLQQLVKTYNDDSFKPFTVPMSLVINLKATKQVGKNLKISFFANKILDYLPDYEANGYTIRRSIKPYFGVEANVIL